MGQTEQSRVDVDREVEQARARFSPQRLRDGRHLVVRTRGEGASTRAPTTATSDFAARTGGSG